jgi:hypothetical protein
MLRITADVNLSVIDQLFIHNTGKRKQEFWAYDAATWNGHDGTFGIEGVWHDRTRPWTRLVATVLRRLPQ